LGKALIGDGEGLPWRSQWKVIVSRQM
jgi:hypothetical protein